MYLGEKLGGQTSSMVLTPLHPSWSNVQYDELLLANFTWIGKKALKHTPARFSPVMEYIIYVAPTIPPFRPPRLESSGR